MNNLNTEQKTILVAGANGNLGLEIIRRLENDVNNRIIAVSREITPIINQLDTVTYYTYEKLFSEQELKIDIIINCAYPNKRDANEDNLSQTSKLALSLMKLGIERWNSRLYINMSCHCVYGEYRKLFVKEDQNIDVRNLDRYAKHRFITELRLEQKANKHIKLINLRLADIMGQMYSQQIIDDMIREALSSNSVTPINIRNRYSFIDIDDVTDVVNRIINFNLSLFNRTVYNLGPISDALTPNFESVTTQNIAEIISNAIPNTITINEAINNEHNDRIRHLMDSTMLFDILHWQPQNSIVDNIEHRTIELYSETLISPKML